MDKSLECFGLCCRILTEFAESFAKGFEDTRIDRSVVFAHKAIETTECLAQSLHTEGIIIEPSIEQVFILYEETDSLLALGDSIAHIGVLVIFYKFAKSLVIPSHFFEILDFGIGEEFVED